MTMGFNVNNSVGKIIWHFFVSFAFVFYASIVQGMESSNFDHEIFNSLLKQHVTLVRDSKASTVNYEGFQRDEKTLKQYLDKLSKVEKESFDSWSKNERLAFLINAYNAWTVQLIVDNLGEIDSIRDIGGLFGSPWKKDFIPLFGDKVSLDHIEHTLIRGPGNFDEPLIHFAVNCASIGCPPLRNEAFVSDKLYDQMEEQTLNFLRDETRNYIKGKAIYVSPILKWYRKDFEQGFGGVDSLSQFLASYSKALGLREEQTLKLKNSEMKIRFSDYDWKLNQ